MTEYYGHNDYRDYLAHYGVKGMKWGKHLYDSVVNDVYRYGDQPYFTSGRMKTLVNAYDRVTGGRLSSIVKARQTANSIRNANSQTVKQAERTYANRARSARLVNKGIAPGGKSENARNYGGSSTRYYSSVTHAPSMQSYNERKVYEIRNQEKRNEVADQIDARVDKTFEVRFAKSIVRAKNAVSNTFRKTKRATTSTINKGKRKVLGLFGKKLSAKRPHSRKKKYSFGTASIFKRKRLRR